MSSRNVYLTPGERRRATCLKAGLDEAVRLYNEGERDAQVLREAVRRLVEDGDPPVDVEYIELVDNETLASVGKLRGPSLLALAVRVGRTRLIDNAVLG
jgi:pantoate--beta-alanine ligase